MAQPRNFTEMPLNPLVLAIIGLLLAVNIKYSDTGIINNKKQYNSILWGADILHSSFLLLSRRFEGKYPNFLLHPPGFYISRAARESSVLHTAQRVGLLCAPAFGKSSARRRLPVIAPV
jgi:hypothetical protein